MKSYQIENIKNQLSELSGKVIVFGIGTIGKLTYDILTKQGVEVDFFCDSDERKIEYKYKNTPVVLPKDLSKFEKNTAIFVSHDYFNGVIPNLKENGFEQIYDSVELLKKTEVDKIYEGPLYPLKLKRRIDYYSEMAKKNTYSDSGKLNLKSIDIQITERCSLKCKDCCNLMQYYTKPINAETQEVLDSTKKIMSVVDHLDEFRVLGGDPFMNKEMHKVVNELVKYENCDRVIIYTNATIIPKNEQLDCLRHPKVILEITNYGVESRAHEKLLELANNEGIKFSTFNCNTWQDCGTITQNSNKSIDDIKHQFNNCCNSDLVTLLHGQLYRCPFSANGENLKAFKEDKKSIIDLRDPNLSDKELKDKIMDLYYGKEYLSACFYCKGRDYQSVNIKSATQTKTPLKFDVVKEL